MTELDLLRRAADSAARATRDANLARDDAREVAVVAIRAAEREVLDALGGGKLRGMVDLMRGVTAHEWRGAHLRRKDLDDELPLDGRRVLALSEYGQIVWVARDVENYDGVALRVRVDPVRDDELVAEDLALVVRNLARVLARHADRSDASSARYAEVLDLAARLARALDR